MTIDPVTGVPRRQRVLVVDDDLFLGEFMVDALAAQDWDVRLTLTVADAQALLADWTPDCVIVDLMMLPTDGTSLISWIRQRFGKQIRLVLYSARQSQETTKVVAQTSHPDAFLGKPFELDDLYKAILGG